ncbi:MAG TPA: MoxR family ATPase [Usitatibacter sp.]|nr:MoxR family ATPase [Usitatibacter sp.]
MSQPHEINPVELQAAASAIASVVAEVRKVIVGQQDIIDDALTGLVSGGHVLVEGVPGLGKTLLVKALARTMGGQFARIQFTPDLMPSDVSGHTLYDPSSGKFTTRKGPVFAHFVLADEINRAPAKTQAALLEVMQEAQVTIEGEAHVLPQPFMVFATQNPIEHEGTYPLPDAQLDRFLLNARIGYPSEEEERQLTRQVTSATVGDRLSVDMVATVIEPAQITRLQSLAARLVVDDRVLDYAVRLARATRDNAALSRGAGPRASIALIRAARARALIAGRPFATPDDVKDVAPSVLRHRITVTPELEIEGRGTDAVIADLLAQVEAPRL